MILSHIFKEKERKEKTIDKIVIDPSVIPMTDPKNKMAEHLAP